MLNVLIHCGLEHILFSYVFTHSTTITIRTHNEKTMPNRHRSRYVGFEHIYTLDYYVHYNFRVSPLPPPSPRTDQPVPRGGVICVDLGLSWTRSLITHTHKCLFGGLDCCLQTHMNRDRLALARYLQEISETMTCYIIQTAQSCIHKLHIGNTYGVWVIFAVDEDVSVFVLPISSFIF